MVWENTTHEDMKKSFEQLFQKNAIALFLTGATATVSTLATVVGHPNTPISAGNGGLSLGLPAFPSRLSIRACGWGGGEKGEGWKEGGEGGKRRRRRKGGEAEGRGGGGEEERGKGREGRRREGGEGWGGGGKEGEGRRRGGEEEGRRGGEEEEEAEGGGKEERFTTS